MSDNESRPDYVSLAHFRECGRLLLAWLTSDVGDDGLERPLLASVLHALVDEHVVTGAGGRAYLSAAPFLSAALAKPSSDWVAHTAALIEGAGRSMLTGVVAQLLQCEYDAVRLNDARLAALVRVLHEGVTAVGFGDWTALHDACASKPEAERLEVAARLLSERLDALVVWLDSAPVTASSSA